MQYASSETVSKPPKTFVEVSDRALASRPEKRKREEEKEEDEEKEATETRSRTHSQHVPDAALHRAAVVQDGAAAFGDGRVGDGVLVQLDLREDRLEPGLLREPSLLGPPVESLQGRQVGRLDADLAPRLEADEHTPGRARADGGARVHDLAGHPVELRLSHQVPQADFGVGLELPVQVRHAALLRRRAAGGRLGLPLLGP
mmetsp:Transcript_108712/g.283520  ORF Transcript_108712/g.283520 Transcript_108712/m.283520 type:complete len:201 (-) Transcript_108712:291-893(-)